MVSPRRVGSEYWDEVQVSMPVNVRDLRRIRCPTDERIVRDAEASGTRRVLAIEGAQPLRTLMRWMAGLLRLRSRDGRGGGAFSETCRSLTQVCESPRQCVTVAQRPRASRTWSQSTLSSSPQGSCEPPYAA